MNTINPTTERVVKVDDLTVDIAKMAQSSIDRAVSRAVRHVLRNEVDSKVLSWAESDAGNAAGANGRDGDNLTLNAEKVRAAKRDESRAAFIEKFYDGTWGNEQRGTGEGRTSPLEAKIRSMCWDDTSNRMLSKGQPLPTPKKPVPIIGLEGLWSKDALVDRQLFEPYKKYDEYKAKATAAIAAAEKAKARAIEKAKDAPAEF